MFLPTVRVAPEERFYFDHVDACEVVDAIKRALKEWIESRGATPIYTDGSKVKGAPSVGYAFYCPKDEKRTAGSLSPSSSIFTAECNAIIGALEYIAGLNGDKFVIVSDSLSALLGVGSLRSCKGTMGAHTRNT
ncbi:hypothetical protein TKK_0009853 [Trichogramma kaykai]